MNRSLTNITNTYTNKDNLEAIGKQIWNTMAKTRQRGITKLKSDKLRFVRIQNL